MNAGADKRYLEFSVPIIDKTVAGAACVEFINLLKVFCSRLAELHGKAADANMTAMLDVHILIAAPSKVVCKKNIDCRLAVNRRNWRASLSQKWRICPNV